MSSILCIGRFSCMILLRTRSVVVPKATSFVNTHVSKTGLGVPGIGAKLMVSRSLCTTVILSEDSSKISELIDRASSTLTDDGNTYVGEFLGDKRHGQGVLTFKNGQVLEGEFRNGRFYNGKCTLLVNEDASTGLSFSEATNPERDDAGIEDSSLLLTSDAHLKAALTSPVGRVYEGEFVNGNLHGFGRVTYADGRVQSGDFKFGHLFTGVGEKNIGDGRRYRGEFKYGKLFGQGRITNVDGSILEGEFRKGEIWQGTGTKRLSNGTTFTGTWRKGKLNGNGIVKLACGGTWTGEFLHGKEHNGFGKIVMKDGRVYEGMLVEGKMHGEGKLIHQGAVQEGEFKYNFFRMGSQRPAEKVDFYRPSLPAPVSRSLDRKGVVYEGEQLDGLRHGMGTLTFKNGQTWEGSFKNGAMYSGEGYVELEDGRTYEGEWLEGYMHGEGKLYLKGKLCWQGEFMLGQKLPNGPSVDASEAQRLQQRAAKYKSGLFKKKKRVWRDNKYKY